MINKMATIAKWIDESSYTVVLTGAGMSTESGVPDFRSTSGWWRNINPQSVANINAFYDNYELFSDFYKMRINTLEGCKPHEGHYILADLEANGRIHFIATQNVDNFHAQAGSKNIAELHGNIYKMRCQQCGHATTVEQFMENISCSCGGNIRPGVVLFGEYLPEKAWQAALQAIQRADLVIVIGTSLQVSPVNQLPTLTNGKKVYINFEVEDFTSQFDLVIEGSAKETLVAIQRALQ